jgi:MYXO-CTERM domain-containing protein
MSIHNTRFLLTTLGAALLALAWGGEGAQAATYTTPAGSTTSDGAVNGTATITPGAGIVTVTLTNLEGNPTGDAQLISALSFNVSGASGSGTLATTNSGSLTTIGSGGTYTAGVSSTLPLWLPIETGTSINLTVLTAPVAELIIGPDSKGNFNPALGGLYSNANPSIINHQPVVLGTATFTITVPGVTATSTLSNVVFQFGTTPGPDKVPGVQLTSPEPSSFAIGGLGVLGLAGYSLRRRRTK